MTRMARTSADKSQSRAEKGSISRALLTTTLGVNTMAILTLALLWGSMELWKFEQRSTETRARYLTSQKAMLERAVNAAVEDLTYWPDSLGGMLPRKSEAETRAPWRA